MDSGAGIGFGYSVKGSSSRRTMSSDKAVSDILTAVAMAREQIITNGGKARVAKALVGLAVENPNANSWMPVFPGPTWTTWSISLCAGISI